MPMSRIEDSLRRLLGGTPFEPLARSVWRRIRRETRNDVYDEQTVAIMRAVLRPDSNCVDIGCHRGDFLDQMLRIAPQGRHYAFEPLPDLFRRLERKYARRARVVVQELALSAASGVSTFHVNTDRPAYSGFRRRDYPSDQDRVEIIEVRTDRLDAVLPGEYRVDFMKVDVEGAELLVFEGAREHLRRDLPVVVFEHGLGSCEYYDSGPDKMFDLLAGLGLGVSVLKGYLQGDRALTREEFERHVVRGINYYFVAHPPLSRANGARSASTG
jgi:FkbM family methyltransferase